jgi:hypothetical protein
VQGAPDGFIFLAFTANGSGHVLPVRVLPDDGPRGVPVHAFEHLRGQLEQHFPVRDFHRA